MSTPKFVEPLKMIKKPSNSMEELDVFEAAKYYSDVHAAYQYNNGTSLSQKPLMNERQPWRAQRMSLDMHNVKNSKTFVIEKPTRTEKKYKQPSSPGGKLASFLNSLFNQTPSKKKKPSKSLKDEEESAVLRKKRSSIDHVWTTRSNCNNNSDPKSSNYLSSVSGCRTPPPYYSYTTKKFHQELQIQSYMNHHQVLALNRVDEKKQGNSERKDNDRLCKGYSEKFKSSSSKFPEKGKNSFADQNISGEKKEFKNFNEDSYDSDSSSDLFELKNYDFTFYSSKGLPVYENTNMDSIKKAAYFCL